MHRLRICSCRSLCALQICYTEAIKLINLWVFIHNLTFSTIINLFFAKKCFGSKHYFCLIADTKPFPLQDDNLVSPITSKCLRDRQQALTNALSKDLIMLGVFVPKCEADGSYCRVQCLNTSRYCWCVDSDGKEIPGTRVRLRQPNCPTVAHSEFP